MNVVNRVLRRAADFQALLDSDFEGPVAMVHLLKFRDSAEYADGRQTDLTGAGAYDLYRRKMVGSAEAAGGRFVFSGRMRHLVLGDVEELWDEILIVEFPTKETFVEVITSPDTADAGVHRRAGLAGQLLVATAGGT